MNQTYSRRRMRSLLFAFILLLGLVPVGMVTADGHTATRTEITFTSTSVEIIQPGEEWVDEAGIYHFRGEISREEVTGDINGEAIVNFNGNFVPSPSCDPESPDECFGEFSAWGSIVISETVETDDNGAVTNVAWDGNFMVIQSFFEGEEPFTLGKIVLAGRGGNAGMSIIGDLSFPEGEEEGAVTITGILTTLAVPELGINLMTQLCFSEESDETSGAFISSGAVESSGAAAGEFFTGEAQWTHRYGLYGDVTVTDEWGSFTLQLVGEVQDHPESSVGWGHFVIVEGTGAYAELYGHGNVTGAAMELLQCDSGFGVQLQFLGQTHMN